MRTTLNRLACFALLSALSAGCKWPFPGGDPEKAEGVNVVNCMVTDPYGAFAFGYVVYEKHGEGSWQWAGEISPQPEGGSCDSPADGTVAYVQFTEEAEWHVRAIQIDFGNGYGAPGTCNSSTGEAIGCDASQIRDATYLMDSTKPTTTFRVQ